jgi:ATP-binding cassette subfamily C protein/ATP-binding cassette subfamily C protein LapB
MQSAALYHRRVSDIANGLNAIAALADAGPDAGSQYAACIIPLLEALEWEGQDYHLAEALPHFIEDVNRDHFRATLANLNFTTIEARLSLNQLRSSLLPCLFEAADGTVYVVVSVKGGEFEVFNGVTRTHEIIGGRGIAGTALIVKPEAPGTLNQGGRIAWLWSLALTFWGLSALILISTFLLNALSLGMPLFMMSIYDVIIPAGSTKQLLYFVGGVTLAIGLEQVFRWSRSAVLSYVAGRIDYVVGLEVFRRILSLPISQSENEPIGTQIAHLQEFESVRDGISGSLGETLVDLPFVVIFIAVIGLLGGWLVLIPIVSVLALVLPAMLISPVNRIWIGKFTPARASQHQLLMETLSGLRTIKFCGAEMVWMDRLRNVFAMSAIGEFRSNMLNHAVQACGRAVILASGIAMVWFGAGMVMNGNFTVGALVACMALGWRVIGPFQSLFGSTLRAMGFKASLRQINHLMRLPPERPAGQVPIPQSYQGRIEFKNVVYRHTPDSDPALSGISFVIEPQEVIAVTGPNGAGKSTLLNVVSGLYRPQLGTYLMGGVDIRQLDQVDLRQNIGLVPQTTELLYGTIAQNLRMGNPMASRSELFEAAILASVHDAILDLPEGYETRLNEQRLSELPEGFKQKLTIARAIIRRPPILLLDEPGQMLDEEGDRALIELIDEFRLWSTVIIVTHRPSHIRIADRLAVMNEGKIHYFGSPEEALRKIGSV